MSGVVKQGVGSAVLVHNAYGKAEVRLTKVIRHADRHEFREISVNVQLEGEFEDTYLKGDNASVVATDSMKNTVYVLAAEHPMTDIEGFGKTLSKHFLDTYKQVSAVTVDISQGLWNRIPYNGGPHPHAFVSGGNECRTASVYRIGDTVRVESGVDNLVVLKTTDSGFAGFVRDRFTTLAETSDRIFATSVVATWVYSVESLDFNRMYELIRGVLLDVFASHKSLSVQQTLYAMGEAVLDACPQVEQITLTMPNQHRIPFNLAPFGLENKNEIFVPTDEPYGLITGTLARK